MKSRKIAALLLALIMVLSLLTACGSKAPEASAPAATAAPAETLKPAEPAAAPAATEAPAPEADPEGPFTITDMGGREITFEHPIRKAYAANPMGIVLIEAMDWDKLGGYSSPLNEKQKNFIPEKYWDLPSLGAWTTATPTANIEELVKADIDVIIMIQVLNDKVRNLAEEIQNSTGIPTVLVSCKLEDIADSLVFMGELFDEQERGNMLADYYRTELSEIKALSDSIPESDYVSYYYAEGADALETDPAGTFHTEMFSYLHLINVADVAENTSNGFVGQSSVSLEQIISWNPDVIIRNASGTGTSENLTVKDILTSPDWAGLTAVQNKSVYATPAMPYNWCDRPPSLIRLMGLKWAGTLLYPDVFTYDVKAEAKEFFSLFFNIDLKDGQLDNILGLAK